jgi:hypothetical protein
MEAAVLRVRVHTGAGEIMTSKRLIANRKNALKSTGPKTKSGKAASSRNAVKHGVLAATPVLPGIENREDWEKHRDGLLESLAPVGYLEEMLTIRLAVLAWRLSRVVRYEAEVSTAALARAESDLEARHERGSGKPSDPAKARKEARRAALVMETLGALRKSSDKKGLDRESAVTILWALYSELPKNVEEVPVPGIPDDPAEFDAFDHWTFGLLRKAFELHAGAAGMTFDALLKKCILSALEQRDRAKNDEVYLVHQGERWKLLLERESRSRMLLEPEVLDKVARYESNLERAFFRTLHEIQRLQASRSGAVVPPPATVDVDLTVNPKGSG